MEPWPDIDYVRGDLAFFDLFDILEWAYSNIRDYLMACSLEAFRLANGLGHSARLFVMGALLYILAMQAGRSRPFAGGACGGRLLRPLLIGALLGPSWAAPRQPRPRLHVGDWRHPSDLEIWAAGQLTMREQLTRAADSELGRRLLQWCRLSERRLPSWAPSCRTTAARPGGPTCRDGLA